MAGIGAIGSYGSIRDDLLGGLILFPLRLQGVVFLLAVQIPDELLFHQWTIYCSGGKIGMIHWEVVR